MSAAPGEMQGWGEGFPGLLRFLGLLFRGAHKSFPLDTGVQFQREASACDPTPSVTITGAACDALA